MARAPMVRKTVRVPPQLWDDAMAAAAERGENLPDELRYFLHRYVYWDESKHLPSDSPGRPILTKN